MFDVLVIGASPAGLFAAEECARSGAKVKILEKRKNFEKTRLPDTSFYGFFDFLNLDVSEKYIRHKVEGMEIISPFDNKIRIEQRGFTIDREKFSNFYLNKAKKAGATIDFDSKVTNIKNNCLIVNNNEKKVSADVYIFACGSRTNLLKKLDVKTMKYPEDLAKAIQADIRNIDIDEDYFHYYMGQEIAPGWKASINPKGDNLYSFGTFVRKGSPKKYFDRFLKRKIFDKIEIVERGKGEDQIITIPNKLVSGNKMFVGGVAGQAGIPFAMKAGELCGKVVGEALNKSEFDQSDLDKYQRLWKKRYNKYYKIARFSLKTIEKMSDKDLDRSISALVNVDINSILEKYSSNLSKSVVICLKMLKKDPGLLKFLKYLSPKNLLS